MPRRFDNYFQSSQQAAASLYRWHHTKHIKKFPNVKVKQILGDKFFYSRGFVVIFIAVYGHLGLVFQR